MSTSESIAGVTSATALQGCTNLKLRQLTRLISQRYDHELAQAGLKTTQYSLLSHVVRLGPIRPSDLAQAMKMDASTLTRNLKPLLTAGWVQLTAGADGRSRLITITSSGHAKRQDAQPHWRAAQVKLNDQLGLDRVLVLHRLVDEALLLLADDVNAEGHG